MKNFFKNYMTAVYEFNENPVGTFFFSIVGIIIAFTCIYLVPQIFTLSILNNIIIVIGWVLGIVSALLCFFSIIRFFLEKKEVKERCVEERDKEEK